MLRIASSNQNISSHNNYLILLALEKHQSLGGITFERIREVLSSWYYPLSKRSLNEHIRKLKREGKIEVEIRQLTLSKPYEVSGIRYFIEPRLVRLAFCRLTRPRFEEKMKRKRELEDYVRTHPEKSALDGYLVTNKYGHLRRPKSIEEVFPWLARREKEN